MGTRDPRVDDYVASSADFARPILTHLRETVHAACPAVEETIKWGMPTFMYEGILCNMAAFKGHCTLGFWKGKLVVGDDARSDEAMGQLGRITSLKELPPKKVLTGYVKRAMQLNAEGVTVPRTKPARARPEAEPPADLAAALEKNAKARATFAGFPPSHRREYIEWITEAKRAETRERRVAQAVEWLAEGKSRNWKYERA